VIYYRPLPSQNLRLDSNANIKISDFGLSALYVGDADGEGNACTELIHTTCGTPNYVAPEVWVQVEFVLSVQIEARFNIII
jgi:serine/threonine protein kinase